MERVNKFKLILWSILGIASAVAVTRFLFGLGVTTNLTDNTPWGFWIGFDVMGGVALAAGGFVIAALNYIFGVKQLHSISRAAILTAFLGYLAVVLGLLFDLGLPWNIWHMVIFWNPHSPLFEVGWCVMLYLSVLTLEFLPVVLEKYPNISILSKLYGILYKIRLPLVILGIMLSTLHQSSLGSLFLAMPYKLHPLWYSPIIPVIFLISAICLGFMMVLVESMTTSYLYGKEQEKQILNKISSYASYLLIFYLLLRFSDIMYRGASIFLFLNSWGTYLFWVEIFISVIIPLTIFSLPFLKKNINLLYFAALSGVGGIVFNRLNVGGLTHLNNLSEIGKFYFPSWTEISVSAGVVSLAILIFFFFIENFKVWETTPVDTYNNPKIKPKFNTNYVYLGSSQLINRTKGTLAFILTFALTFSFFSGKELDSKGTVRTIVTKARGGDTLFIDGNRDSYGVMFPHKQHQVSGISCGYCHHLNKPDDNATGCYECHNDMYLTSDAFRHDWHSSSNGANLNCLNCHNKNKSKGNDFIQIKNNYNQFCLKCHKNIIPPDSRIKNISTYKSLSYTDAMHSVCISCHTNMLKTNSLLKERKPGLALCSNCHRGQKPYEKPNKIFETSKNNKWVVIPKEKIEN